MWTALPTGNAIVSGSFRMVASQLKSATIDATMPHQTHRELSPVRPVHDHALVGSAVSVAPSLIKISAAVERRTQIDNCTQALANQRRKKAITLVVFAQT